MNHSLFSTLCALFVLAGCSSDASAPPAATAGASGSATGGSAGSSLGGSSSNAGASGATIGGSSSAGAGAANSAGMAGESASAGAAGTTQGGNGGAAGSAGASGGNAGSAGAGSCAGTSLCDDFETNAPGDAASSWKIISKNFSLERVSDQAHSGTHSMHVKGTADSGYAYLEETKTFPSTDFWGRAYLRVQAPSGGHQVFIGLDGNANEGQGEQIRLLNNLGGGKVATNRRSDDKSKNSATSIPMGTWFCYEWHEAPAALSIYLDGKELTDVDEAWQEPTLVSLVIGMERFTPGMAGDVWIDDVAVGNARVGCN